MVEMMMNKETSHRWWFDSHHISSGSPWLQSTLAELDKKTKSMLKLIEADADSFAQRAEMYYKKRPELISMVEDFYRAHRSLAERYDQLKSDSGNRLLVATFGSPFSTKHRREKLMSVEIDQTYDCHSETCDTEDSAESEVDDPEQDPEQDQIQVDEELEEIETPEEKKETHTEDSAESEVDDPEHDQIQVDGELEEIETAEEMKEAHVEDFAESEVEDLEQDQIQVGEELEEIETLEDNKKTGVDEGMKHAEVEDLEQDQIQVGEELEEIETLEDNKKTGVDEGMKHAEVRSMYNAEVTKLKEEIERLEEEKRIYNKYLLQKDEESREQKKKISEERRAAEISSIVYNAEVMKLREEIASFREEKTISKNLLQKHEEKKEEKKENVEVMKLREEIEGFGEESRIYKEHLLQKDEEKREAIRQLSFAVELLKLENEKLRKWVANQKRSHFTVEKLKDVFRGKLFNGSS